MLARIFRESKFNEGRLLLLSGGVDSSACLPLLNEKDYAITFIFEPSEGHSGIWHSARKENVKKLQEILGFNHTFIEVPFFKLNDKDGFIQPKFRHQADFLLPYTMGLIRNYPHVINEVWFGSWANLTKKRIIDSTTWPLWEEYFDLFSYGFHHEKDPKTNKYYPMKKTIDLVMPLSNLSKAQQWNMIPKECRPYVITCWNILNKKNIFDHKGCGGCDKCIERIHYGVPLEPSDADAKDKPWNIYEE
jgi:7-cyano-7-deazaguanine synthase in queuosine biosynthesis